MKFVWLILNTETNEVIALYDTKEVAKKLAPQLAKKVGAEVEIEKRTINLDFNLIGVKP